MEHTAPEEQGLLPSALAGGPDAGAGPGLRVSGGHAETDTICAEQPPDGEPKARYPGGWHGAVAWTALFVILVIIVATFAAIVAQIQATSS
jgi:hypothetical protein